MARSRRSCSPRRVSRVLRLSNERLALRFLYGLFGLYLLLLYDGPSRLSCLIVERTEGVSGNAVGQIVKPSRERDQFAAPC